MTSRRLEAFQGFGFIVPVILVLFVFTVLPLGYAFVLSLMRVNQLAGTYEFVGLANYQLALNDPRVHTALMNTLRYVIIVVPTQTAIALIMAVALNSGIKFQKTFRTVYFLPTLTSSSALTMIFMFLFAVNGPANDLLVGLGFIETPINFVQDVRFALNSIMIMNIWATVPFYMTIYLAALQDVPDTLYEAASLDGANSWQKLTKITIPNVVPVTNFVLLMGIIGCFQVFDQAFIVSAGSGGPANATLTFSLVIYQYAFMVIGTMGYAATLAIILAAIIFVVSIVARKLNREETLY
ncbi:MAG: sugar ABC transporter permease [Defluviitaleaceae bacterium]|nr:sugar ABC transporter permease [Defluviitaleaceae bacterium]